MKRLAHLAFAFIIGLSTSAHSRSWSIAEVDDLERAARAAPEEGVQAPGREIARLELMRRVRNLDPVYQADLDLAADALFQSLAQTYARGAVDPASVDTHWRLPLPRPTDIALLEASLAGGAWPSGVLQQLLPKSAEYRALRFELARVSTVPQTAETRAQRDQIRANLERWRWLPRDMPARRVEVRLAQFELFFHREDAPLMRHAVIVGARRTPSPVFNATIESATLNPDWTPPQSILANELLPRFRRNPSAAEAQDFEVLDNTGRVISARDVDWNARPFPYRLRQRPGSGNALGQIRFNLPNPFAVFLHDTPSRTLFNRQNRALSHGCIRVQQPLALAAALIAPSEWDEAALHAVVETGSSQTIPLPAPTPVYVLYLTATIDESGGVMLLEDIYRRDPALIAALDAEAAALASVHTLPDQCSP